MNPVVSVKTRYCVALVTLWHKVLEPLSTSAAPPLIFMNVREKPGECPGQRRGRDCLRRSNRRLGPQAEVWKGADLRRQCFGVCERGIHSCREDLRGYQVKPSGFIVDLGRRSLRIPNYKKVLEDVCKILICL